jgi:hypothetical protein
MIDFREVIKGLSTVQLKAIRQVLVSGAEVVAERKYANADGSKRLKALAAENEQLKKANAQLKKIESRRQALSEIGLDLEDDRGYWLELNDATFRFVVNKFAETIEKELALSSEKGMQVPALTSEPELDTVDAVREGLKDLKRNG